MIERSCGARSQITPSDWYLPRFMRDEVMKYTSPRTLASISSLTLLTGGLYTKVWPGISVRPRRAAISIRSRASADVVASGFSTSTCLPASSAALAIAWCVRGGVATTSASMLSSLRTSSRSLNSGLARRNAPMNAAPRSGSRSHRPANSSSGRSMTLRTRLGPQ